LLLSKYKLVKLFDWQREIGRNPVNELLDNDKHWREGNAPTNDGMMPEKEFSLRSKYAKFKKSL